MPVRIRADHITVHLEQAGCDPSQWDREDFDQGFRVEQHGPRLVLVFHDGPGEGEWLAYYLGALLDVGYQVVLTQVDTGRRRLEVTHA